jgi:hypothetical protein
MGDAVTRPGLRWLVPGGLVAAMAATGALAAGLHPAATALPHRSAEQLLVDLASPRADGVSGTLAERADLGLPALPAGLGGDGRADFVSLFTGSHTLRVWSAGPTRSRIALLGTLGESDLVRNGSDLWIWSSSDNTARHLRLPGPDTSAGAGGQAGSGGSGSAGGPGGAGPAGPSLPSDLATLLAATPLEMAARLLSAIGPSTSVGAGGTVRVAGRAAYELVIAPRDKDSLVNSVRIDIDGVTRVPLRVRVFARGYAPAAFEIGFTQVSYQQPVASLFKFVPAPDVKVIEGTGGPGGAPEAGASGAAGAPTAATVIGSGWTAILAAQLPARDITGSPGGRPAGGLDGLLRQLPRVTGAWGSGRLVQARLVSVLVTDDGRLFVGPVATAALLLAAGSPAGALVPGSGITHR